MSSGPRYFSQTPVMTPKKVEKWKSRKLDLQSTYWRWISNIDMSKTDVPLLTYDSSKVEMAECHEVQWYYKSAKVSLDSKF